MPKFVLLWTDAAIWLLAAVLVAAALLQQSSATKVYLVANRDLGAGATITAQDVRTAELSLGAESRFKLVAGRLIVNPPLAARHVFLRGRCLNPIDTCWPEIIGALLGNRIPIPHAKLHAHFTLVRGSWCCRSAAGEGQNGHKHEG